MKITILVLRDDAAVAIANALSNDVAIPDYKSFKLYIVKYFRLYGLSCLDEHARQHGKYIRVAKNITNRYYNKYYKQTKP